MTPVEEDFDFVVIGSDGIKLQRHPYSPHYYSDRPGALAT
jgi:hypothetical protein